MQRRSVPRTDPRYNQIRSKNNDSVKKSREKARRERDDTVSAIDELEEENEQLTQRLQAMKSEYQQLQDLFKQHTGIAIDQLLTAKESASSAPPVEPPPTVTPAQPVLTINTNDVQPAVSSASSSAELDAATLDGAIVLINGVQYKIVSMNKPSDSSSL